MVASPKAALSHGWATVRQTQAMMPRFVLAGYVFKAWNAARKGDPIKVLRMMDGETLPEVA